MAFATTNVKVGTLGGPFKVYAGDWSGSAGDASGSITLGGGRVYQAHFENQDASPDSPKERPLVDVSVSSGVITLTVHNHMDVTLGRFLIVFA